MKRFFLPLLIWSLASPHPVIASSDHRLGMAVGLAAAIKCAAEKEQITKPEEIPLLEYHLQENNLAHLKDYLSSKKGQTAIRITAEKLLDDRCEIKTLSKSESQKLNKLLLFYAPEGHK